MNRLSLLDGTEKKRDGPEILYYNVEIINPNSLNNNIYAPNTVSVPCQVVAANNIPILNNPDDYYMTVLSASIPLRECPLFEMIIQTPIPNIGAINNTIYSITMQYVMANGTLIAQGAQTFMIYVPRNNYTPPNYVYPAPVQIYNSYYYVYQVQQITDMINVAFASALTSLKAQSGTGPIAAATAPYINYDATTQLLTIFSEETYYDSAAGTPYIQVYCNKLAEPWFSGFPKITNTLGTGLMSGADDQLVIKSYNGSNVTGGIISTIQNYTNYGYWAFVKNILVATNMNVNSEIFYTNQTFQQQQNALLANGALQQNQTFTNVLYSFLPDLSQLAGELGAAAKIQVYNGPTNLYHPITFNQKTPLYEISISVYMQDRFNNTIPLPLSVNDVCNFKLQFIRKDLVRF